MSVKGVLYKRYGDALRHTGSPKAVFLDGEPYWLARYFQMETEVAATFCAVFGKKVDYKFLRTFSLGRSVFGLMAIVSTGPTIGKIIAFFSADCAAYKSFVQTVSQYEKDRRWRRKCL